jgi:DNA-binding NtrC family response regulator
MSASPKNNQAVLVAEDEGIILAGVICELEAAGFAVIAASDAQEALREFKQHPEVTAVFTDINMPGPFDGLSLAHMIARLRPSVQLILTSGRKAPLGNEMPRGARFLSKPYDCASVAAMIDAIAA